jgi:hypothetical protein
MRPEKGLVLYPHFQRQVVPGWLDKAWKRRHRASPALDNLVLLSRITVVWTPTGTGSAISGDYFIDGITHDITPGDWTTTYSLWPCASFDAASPNASTWDSGTWDTTTWIF